MAIGIFPANLYANPFLHRQGTQIVDGRGRPVRLRGVMVEGWLQWNGSLWSAGLTSETKIRARIEEMIGPEDAGRFQQAVYDEFITEADFLKMNELGFNAARIAFNHTILEDDNRPFVYKQRGWELLDRAIAWGERHDIYIILDLHSAPGGQSDVFVSDPDAEKLWETEQNIERTVALWKAIANRYKDKRIIAGYDLLNEPHFDELVPVYERIIKGVREVDNRHMVIISAGGIASSDFSMFDGLLDENSAFAFHTYNFLGSDTREDRIMEYMQFGKEHSVPILNTEFGAHSVEWTGQVVNHYETHDVVGWIFWPWKRVPSFDAEGFSALVEITGGGDSWEKTRKYIGSLFGFGRPDKEQALRGLRAFLDASRIENCRVNQDTLRALFPD
ncbi:MAG: cellulase family glycosylhydrolase [Leptospiraceae bacterium]|nr:cellulase family glycosylhydrolase [Leptospiraceae bacterium]MCB1315023.1 cellulase family glycosylhydrolase [Leptospiraceae bacterium]